MAANIVKIEQRHVTSNYGDFHFPIVYLDVPVNVGDWTSCVMRDFNASALATRGTGQTYNTPLPKSRPASPNVGPNMYCYVPDYQGVNVQNSAMSLAQTIYMTENKAAFFAIFVGSNNKPLWNGISIGIYDGQYYQTDYIPATATNFGIVSGAMKPGVADDVYLYTTSVRPTQANIDFATAILEGSVPDEPEDPFAPGGTSEPGGGNGTFNGTSDSNPIPGDPAISATDTGFMTVFATNVAGLRSLANSLWTDLFSAIKPGGTLEDTVKALKNVVGSPYDAILGCHIVPVNVPVGASRNVKLYGVLPSEVSLPVASSQWVHKDCGSLTIQPYDGSYLDYAPYSKVTSLYLPFVGVVSVDIDIIMNTTIGVYYKIDIVSGQCIVYVTKNGDVYFQYQGQCAVPIPVTSIDWSTTVSSGLGLIGSVTNIVGSAVGGALAGGPAGALSGAVTGTIGQAGSMAQNVMNSKPDIKAGSGVGGAAALLGCKSPYLIIERPRKSTPARQNHYTGYPSNIRAKLGDLEGYTEVSRVYVNHMNATTEEKAEIERLLYEGVVL